MRSEWVPGCHATGTTHLVLCPECDEFLVRLVCQHLERYQPEFPNKHIERMPEPMPAQSAATVPGTSPLPVIVIEYLQAIAAEEAMLHRIACCYS